MITELIPPQPLDVVQWVTVRMHANGTVSTAGTIADKRTTLRLLAIATDAVKNQVSDYKAIVVPNREVDAEPSFPVREMGVMLEHERGDP